MFNKRRQRCAGCLAGVSSVVLSCGLAGGDIYEWEYIDPLNPALGRQASGVLLSTEDPVPLVNLRDAVLPKAYLAGADLTAAKFRRADLTDADMYGANLSAASFAEATLAGAIFYDAIIRNADFSSTTSRGFTQQQLAETASHRAGVLTGLVLAENNLSGWDFSGKNLTGAQFGTVYFDFSLWYTASNLTNADFSQTLLTRTSFLNATVTGADFTNAIVAGVWLNNVTGFTYTQLASTLSYQIGDLSGIGLYGNDMAGWDLSGQDLTNAYMSYGRLAGADLGNANLADANLSYADLAGANLSGADLTDATLQHADIPNADFTGADLTKATLMQMDASNADFTGANLTRSGFSDSNISGVILTDADITRASFSGSTNLSLAQLVSTANYQSGDLSGVVLQSYANVAQQDFSGIDLSGFNLTDTTLRATFDGADFSNADLTGTRLDRTSLVGADFTDAIIDGAFIASLSLQQLQSTANYRAGDLSGLRYDNAGLSGLDLSGFNLAGFSSSDSDLSSTDFSGADLTGAGLNGGDLTGANFTDAIIKGMFLGDTVQNGFTYQQLTSTASFQAGDLGSISLIRNNLSGWDLSGLSLVGARLGASVQSPGETNLSGTDLSRSDLTGADFIGSNLLNTDLTDAIIKGARLKDALNLTNAQVMSTASYKTGDLSGILWWNLDLSGWDLSGVDHYESDFEDANLTGANLAGSSFIGADFYRADLINADLRDANLTDTRFSSADLTGANLAGADTRRAVGSGFGSVFGNTTNTIWWDGVMYEGLVLSPGESFRLKDLGPWVSRYGAPSVIAQSVTVLNHFALDESTLQIVFTDPDWQSMIQFDASVNTAELGGTLAFGVDLLDGIGMQDLAGRTFDVFDWSGVAVHGGFDAIIMDPAWFEAGLSLDLSQLMTDGSVRVVPFVGDLDGDGFVGFWDLLVVLAHWNQNVTPGNLLQGDMNGDGMVFIEDLNGVLSTWNRYVVPPGTKAGTPVPEPTAGLVLSAGGVCLLQRRQRGEYFRAC